VDCNLLWRMSSRWIECSMQMNFLTSVQWSRVFTGKRRRVRDQLGRRTAMEERAGRSAVPPDVSLALVSCVSLHRIFSSIPTGGATYTGSNREEDKYMC